MTGRRFFRWLAFAVLATALAGTSTARAGGGPENVFLVVNANSWASRSIANHFVQLRQMSPINVFYLNWTGGFESITGETFRTQILNPTLTAIERRGIGGQIDYIVYSSDFPYAVDLGRDFSNVRMIDQARPGCSINSATYLWQFVVSRNPLVMNMDVNQYMRAAQDRTVAEPSHEFRAWYGWGRGGRLMEAGGQPFMLSTVLGVTSGRGNSVSEVVSYLKRAASSDGTQPSGTIYLCKTDNVRSTTRSGQFDQAVRELAELGVKAEIISTDLPISQNNVMGVTSGVADFSWPRTRSTILPGAICENFTSFGGIMAESGGQTPLTEFLRYGAAGSSGTVIEPYAIGAKFPSPLVHVHYARGCTLAEAYYQSVYSPAQLLIVGDPLCRPWADIPQVEVDGLPADGQGSVAVEFVPRATSPGGAEMAQFELFVDGRRMGSARPGGKLSWDSTTESDGYHELRVVAIAAGPIASQVRVILPVTVDNHQQSIQFALTPAEKVRWGQTLKARVAAPGMKQLLLIHDARVVGRVSGEQGEIDVNPRQFGIGPVTLQAVAMSGNAAAERVWSAPARITVQPGAPLPALSNPPAQRCRGLVLQLPDRSVLRVDETSDPAWLSLKGIRANQPFVVQGFFDAEKTDVYQFQLWHYGDAKLSIDGHTLYDGQKGDYSQKFVPVALAAGMHRLTLTGRTANDVKLRILFGGPGATSLSRDRFVHAR